MSRLACPVTIEGMRLGPTIVVLAAIAAAAVLPGPGATRSTDLTAAEAIAIVRQIVAEGLECAYPGSGLSVLGYRAWSKGGGITVTARVTGKTQFGDVLTFGIDFWVFSASDVRPPNAAAKKILECAGPLGPLPVPRVKAFTKKGTVEPGTSVSLEFAVFDESGVARVYLNLYEGGAWKKRWSRKMEAKTFAKKHSAVLELPDDVVGPLRFCLFAVNPAGQKSKDAPISSCGKIALLVDLAKVSNGCGGKGWDSIVKVQNFFGNTSTYTDAVTGRSFTVSFIEACNLHDAGYGGQTVVDKLHDFKRVDFQSWTRKQVDLKFRKDMELICEREILNAPDALKQCKENIRYTLVRKVGWKFFDADLFTPGIQDEGTRPNG